QPSSTLFPYTTLFRSSGGQGAARDVGGGDAHHDQEHEPLGKAAVHGDRAVRHDGDHGDRTLLHFFLELGRPHLLHAARAWDEVRSEEHTSELQSLAYL